MNKEMISEELLKDYYEIFSDSAKIKDFSSYYKALVQIIKKYPLEFTNEVRDEWGLNELIIIDENEYIVDKPDLCLSMERKRLVRKYEDIDTLAMAIRDTLWDMVTIYSGKDCPLTPNDELRYIKIVYKDSSNKILLECAECGWTEDIDGDEYNGPIGKVFPVREGEVEKYIK
ncbi:hypothetical protein HBP39_09415 [Listeria welshimeri]|uniref:hypothetical protein n=1 Tax=Listeria welshimeri TaxID=1643 RepID=UPI001625D2B5|nr:hypothetical protein [Listeria welshimeri]MBC1405577.1 hypothetical protein [Listeria welshimeri]MBC1591331.1 hypothetical protein [Listeria welshimeri]MBC1608180.1 hypothetical protein [Listeria welshimeri]MBC1620326.1 hypothetical protein [Listeria welshimeri]MBC1625418.1 hypothetical protein [Listeria welshimeri]